MDDTFTHDHIDDVNRIQRCLHRHGFHVEKEEATQLWDSYCLNDFGRNWIGLPKEDNVLWGILKDEIAKLN